MKAPMAIALVASATLSLGLAEAQTFLAPSVTYQESVQGDLATYPDPITVCAFGVGTSTVSGNSGSAGPDTSQRHTAGVHAGRIPSLGPVHPRGAP